MPPTPQTPSPGRPSPVPEFPAELRTTPSPAPGDDRRRPRPRCGHSVRPRLGLSLLEVLVASALFGVLVLAILPLFSRAALLTQAGRRATLAAHLAGSRAEELLSHPFEPPTLGAPSDSERTTVEYRPRDALTWTPHRPPAPAEWIRTTTLRLYRATALDDRELSNDEALPPGARGAAQLQEIEVEVRAGNRHGPFGAGARASVRVLKAR